MEIKQVVNSIKKWSDNIEQIIYLADIKGKEHIENYRLKDFQNIYKLMRKCERCGKEFLPHPNFKKWQKYCDIQCRNQATCINRYEIKLDDRQRPVDLLRKSIYERKYRARRDNISIDIDSFDILLKKLTVLVKQRWDLTEQDYNNKITDLYKDYKTIVQRGKGGT